MLFVVEFASHEEFYIFVVILGATVFLEAVANEIDQFIYIKIYLVVVILLKEAFLLVEVIYNVANVYNFVVAVLILYFLGKSGTDKFYGFVVVERKEIVVLPKKLNSPTNLGTS